MSSNFRVKRICKNCESEFEAQKTTTQYCSQRCAGKAYKDRIRGLKIESSNQQTQQVKTQQIDEIKAKEFLTVRDVSKLLNCSRQTIYNLINSGVLSAVNIKVKKTLIKRYEIDKLFSMPVQLQQVTKPEPVKPLNEDECYNLSEVQQKYGISEKALHELIKRNSIPKIKKGWYAYVSKEEIDKLLT